MNFLPVSKILSHDSIDINFIYSLKSKFTKAIKDIEISLVEQKKYKRLKVDIFNSGDIAKAKIFLECNEKIIATFNYHFLASYSSEIFGKVVKETIKDIDKSIFYIQDKLEHLEFDFELNFKSKPFTRVNIFKIGNQNNLIVGENKFVSKQSAAFYSGMYQPACDAIIQPILVDNYPDIGNYQDLIERFNKGATNFELLSPIRINSTNKDRFNLIISKKKEFKSKRFLVTLFTEYEQGKDFIQPLKSNLVSFQIYLGAIDNFKLSNFTVKCLEKLGGLLSIIWDMGEKDNTYFVGIDLGHSKQNEDGFSNLALVFFNKNGRFLHSVINKDLPRNEAISVEVILPCFRSFRNYLKNQGQNMPEKLIIHRDGKLHLDDEDSIIKQAREQLNVDNIDVVEIIKQGYPVFACFEVGAYINLNSGDYYLDNDNKYAILITNIQADEKNAILNPIIIKHKIGNTSMQTIVKQVYWLTRIYTNNLYNSTRLPATTLKANNIVSTSMKIHQATYVG